MTVLAVLLCLSACGSADDPICGRYRCVGAETEGLFVQTSLLSGDPVVLTLSPDGRGTLLQGEAEGSLTWTRSGDGLCLDAGGTKYDAHVREGEILLELEPGLILRFVREEQLETMESAPDPGLWEWYGWWSSSESTGRMPDTWADCCARLEEGDFGPVLTIWDEATSYDEPLARVQMRWENGVAVSESGWFLVGSIDDGIWRVAPGQPLELEGQYQSAEERFSFRFCLRPWGAAWEEEGQRLPLRYSDWYLPLVQKKAAMPDRID